VKLLDVNLLLYAYNKSAPMHLPAKRWLSDLFDSGEEIRLAWATIHAFVRIATHQNAPLWIAPALAATIVSEWLDRPTVAVLDPGNAYWPIFRDLLVEAQIRGDLVSDAHLAALAIEHGATLCSTDRDFTRFPGLRFENPLTANKKR